MPDKCTFTMITDMILCSADLYFIARRMSVLVKGIE